MSRASMGRDRCRQGAPSHRRHRWRRPTDAFAARRKRRVQAGQGHRRALERADSVTWAIDLADGPAALMTTLLLECSQRLLFLLGIAVNRAAGAYRGEG